MSSAHRVAFGFLFFLSGALGLIYEVLWQRALSLSFGVTGFAIAIILAAYMSGLALGTWIGGRQRRVDAGPHRAVGRHIARHHRDDLVLFSRAFRDDRQLVVRDAGEHAGGLEHGTGEAHSGVNLGHAGERLAARAGAHGACRGGGRDERSVPERAPAPAAHAGVVPEPAGDVVADGDVGDAGQRRGDGSVRVRAGAVLAGCETAPSASAANASVPRQARSPMR